MRPFSPENEVALKRLATRNLGRKPPSDSFWSKRLPHRVLAWPLLPPVFAWFVAEWADASPTLEPVILGLALAVLSVVAHLSLNLLEWNDQHTRTWLHLPVAGEWLARRKRRQHSLALAGLLGFCLVYAYRTEGLQTYGTPLARGALLFLTAGATAYLLGLPFIQRLRLPWIWALIGLLFLSYWWAKDKGSALWDTGRVLLENCAWLFPSSWIKWTPLWNLGELFAILWILAGSWAWRSFPRRMGPALDGKVALDYLSAGGCPDDEEECETATEEIEQTVATVDRITQAESLTEPHWNPEGWVERLAVRWLDPSLQSLAAICCPDPGWTMKWKLALLAIPLSFTLMWLSRFLPYFSSGHAILVCSGVVLLLTALAINFPLGDHISPVLARATWAERADPAPVLALLPISMEQLLALSQRLTLVRCLPFLSLVYPLVIAIFFWAGGSPRLLAALLSLCIALAAAQPAFVGTRLLWVAQATRAHRLSGILLQLAVAFLGAGGAVAGLASVSVFFSELAAWPREIALMAVIVGLIGLEYGLARAAFGLVLFGRKSGRLGWSKGLE